MRRSAPRPLAAALAQVRSEAEPATVLARVQACWLQAVGPVVAGEARPVAERGGVVTVECRSAAWAQELQLLAGEVIDRLNGVLVGGGAGPLVELRARIGGRDD